MEEIENIREYTNEETDTLSNLAEFLMESALRLVGEGVISKSQFPELFSKSLEN